jgi:hypothetical protein
MSNNQMTNQSTITYKAKLAEIVNKCGLNDQTNPAWNELNDLITSEVLEAAYFAGLQLEFLNLDAVPNLNAVVTRRDLKTMERINVKKAMKDRPDLGFKTNCDLMGFRILIKDIKLIPMLVETIKVLNESLGNKVHVRGSITNDDGHMTDIIQYMYVYHANAGFLAEYQIGHPFAALKFTHDSAIRDGKPGGIDFKKGKIKMYNVVKEKLIVGDTVDIASLWFSAFDTEASEEFVNCF